MGEEGGGHTKFKKKKKESVFQCTRKEGRKLKFLRMARALTDSENLAK